MGECTCHRPVTMNVLPILLVIFIGIFGIDSVPFPHHNHHEFPPGARTIPEMSVPDLIRYWGYQVEEHFVTTEDGYILGLHRIPASSDSAPVVYLQHGLTSSSSSWTFGPPSKSLGYLLADAGYDVWMGNSRGNSYSRNHTTLEVCSTAECAAFWDFGWHEGGMYDVTAGIDYALKVTGQSKVNYLGHSMGCTQYLVMLSQLPEYNEKIRLGILLAPPAFMEHATSPIFSIAQYAGGVEKLYHLFGLYEFLPHSEIIHLIGELFCSDEHPLSQEICENIAFLLLGSNPSYINGTMFPTYLDHIPEGTSTRPFVHYAQLFLSGNWEAYDFGEEGNEAHYNQSSQPVYSLSNVVTPTAIFKGNNDELVDLQDINKLVDLLPNVVFDHLVDREGWSHLDYIIAMDADTKVYSYVLDLFNNANIRTPTIIHV